MGAFGRGQDIAPNRGPCARAANSLLLFRASRWIVRTGFAGAFGGQAYPSRPLSESQAQERGGAGEIVRAIETRPEMNFFCFDQMENFFTWPPPTINEFLLFRSNGELLFREPSCRRPRTMRLREHWRHFPRSVWSKTPGAQGWQLRLYLCDNRAMLPARHKYLAVMLCALILREGLWRI